MKTKTLNIAIGLLLSQATSNYYFRVAGFCCRNQFNKIFATNLSVHADFWTDGTGSANTATLDYN